MFFTAVNLDILMYPDINFIFHSMLGFALNLRNFDYGKQNSRSASVEV